MVRAAVPSYARDMDGIPPQEQAPPEADAELSEAEVAEIEERLRGLGYID